ncbi:MAG TPA: NrfD/PsrC family molybdoenzyme membrane anchor subunit [Dehalococcoidales bacterium]|nr:NrfD/PsrC family molybdoenzyme membrane anchor subunit [Dehalococcoidales bacterium]
MQTARQWMITQDWMVTGNRQTEWIEKRGLILWLAFYTGGLGGGLFIVSLFFNSLWGMLIGWIIVAVIKGGLHFAFLGRPSRFWRLIMHPQTSWLSRGLMFVAGFAGFGFLLMLASYFLPEQTALILALKIVSGVFALCVATYTGFVLNKVKGVPFWDLSLLPVLFVACAILGGFGMMTAIGVYDPSVNLQASEAGTRIMLIINVLLISLYLFIASRREGVGKKSVLMQIRGSISPQFWVGVVLLGIVIPAIIAIYTLIWHEAAAAVLIFGTVCEVTGGAMLRYCVLKSGMYNPLFSKDSIKRGPIDVRA